MTDRDALIAGVLEGPLEVQPWSQFLQKLRVPTGADHATLIFRPPGRPLSEALHVYSGTAPQHTVRQVYASYFSDRAQLGEFEMSEGRVYSFGDFYPPKEDQHLAFFEQVMVPRGIRSARMMRVIEPTGVNAWLSISREAANLNPDANVILRSLATPLRASLRFYVELERERFAAGVIGDAMRSLHFGWITLDAQGFVIDHDASGGVVLSQSNVLFRNAAGKVAARPKRLSQALETAIQKLVRCPQARPVALVLSRDPWLDMLLVRSTKRKLGGTPAPTIVAYVHGDSWASVDRCSQLTDLFGLSPSEARLALALSRGRTLKESAEELALSVETVRSYSKNIYAKTGAKGQADLVRIVMRSVMAFSPG